MITSVFRMPSAHTLLLVILAAFILINLGCPPPPPPPPSEVRGTITTHGFNLSPSDLQVRARPLPGEEDDPAKARPVVVNVTRVAGGGPSRLAFRLTGLEAGMPYRIGIKVNNQDTALYPRFVWSSDRDPLVQPGEADLRFDAYAVLSEISVLAEGGGRDREMWVGADALDFTEPDLASRTFAWRTLLPDVTGGQLQISLSPFPRTAERVYDPCDHDDERMVYTMDFEAEIIPGEWVSLPPVNFYALLIPEGREDPDGGPFRDGKAGAALANPAWESQVLPELEMGHPLYVRVLPKRGEEVICDPDLGGVPPEVLLAKMVLKILSELEQHPEISLGTVWYNPPAYGARPYKGEVCYRILKDHKLPPMPTTLQGWSKISTWDILVAKHMSGVTYNQTAKRGMSFCVPPDTSDEGWLESFANSFAAVITGIIDAVGNLVNYTSNLWEEIKGEVVKAAAGVIDNFVDCGPGTLCRGALETGLEIGMAAMGVPPFLPNFDELMDEGVGYLSAQVAAQSGVPSVLTDYAAQETKDFVKNVVNNMKSNYGVPKLPDWLAPDIRFEPAYLVIDLYGRGKNFPYNSPPYLIRNHQTVYAGAGLFLPRHLPKPGVEPPIKFPMVLPPNNDGLPAMPPTVIQTLGGPMTFYPNEYEKSVWDKNTWINQRYKDGCYLLYLVALSNPGGIYNIFSAQFKTEDPSMACN